MWLWYSTTIIKVCCLIKAQDLWAIWPFCLQKVKPSWRCITFSSPEGHLGHFYICFYFLLYYISRNVTHHSVRSSLWICLLVIQDGILDPRESTYLYCPGFQCICVYFCSFLYSPSPKRQISQSLRQLRATTSRTLQLLTPLSTGLTFYLTSFLYLSLQQTFLK